MGDIVERLRGKHRARTVTLPDILHEAADEIERLHAALRRIDALNDHPGHYNPDIQRVLDAALTGKP